MLLSLDVPSHSRNYKQKTPYDFAVASGHSDCAKVIGNNGLRYLDGCAVILNIFCFLLSLLFQFYLSL